MARRTPLYDIHLAAGARMVDFAGWEMPVQYAGVLEEHRAVRERAGLFDVSHMGEISVRGPGALELLQRTTCNDVARLQPGRAHYSAFTTPRGTFVDDLLVYRLGDEEFLVVVNASNAAKDFAWIDEHAQGVEAQVRDVSDTWCQLALQGPLALQIAQPLVDHDLSALKYYAFVETRVDGVPSLVSRTGYTGEDGFEIYAGAAQGPRLWNALVRAGEPAGLAPVGLGARDTLRLEAKMTLYGNGIDDTTSVLEADLGWIAKLDKGPFVGRDVLARQKDEGVARKLVGFEMLGRTVGRHGHPCFRGATRVGEITSGSFAPQLKKNIGLVYLPRGMWEPGTAFDVEIRGRREGAVVVATPFYKRAR